MKQRKLPSILVCANNRIVKYNFVYSSSNETKKLFSVIIYLICVKNKEIECNFVYSF